MAKNDDPSARLLTAEEKKNVDATFMSFKAAYGQELVDIGWDRKTVFRGLNPPDAITLGDVHGIIWLLMGGGRVE